MLDLLAVDINAPKLVVGLTLLGSVGVFLAWAVYESFKDRRG